MNINKIISLYLSLKLFRSILICLLVLLTIISLIDFSDLYFNSRFKENGSFSRTIIMTFQNIPILIDTLLLYSILFGSVLCFIELRKTQEIMILKVNGLSPWQIIIMLSIIPILISIFSLFLLSPIKSISSKYFQINYEKIYGSSENLLTISSNGLWLRDISENSTLIIKGDIIELDKGKIINPTIFIENSQSLFDRIKADFIILKDGFWYLNKYKYSNEKEVQYKPKLIKSSLTKNDLSISSNNLKNLSIFEINAYINILEKTGLPSKKLKLYFYKMLAQPLGFIAMTILSYSLIFGWFSKTPQIKMIAFTICAGLIYFFIQKLFTILGSAGQLPVFIATCFPEIILLSSGLYITTLSEEK